MLLIGSASASEGYGAGGYGDGPYGDESTDSDGSVVVSTGTAADVRTTSVTLTGSLDDLGGASLADCSFEYRQTGASSWSATASETLSSIGSFSASVSGLLAGTEYEFRALASDSDGDTDTGSTVTFTTQSETALSMSTGAASDVGSSSATFAGSLEDLGGADSVECAFEYRPASSDSWTATRSETLSSTGTFSTSVSGLSSGTDYEYRALGNASDSDSDTGKTATFKTEAASTESSPVVEVYSVTEAGSPNPHAEITADWTVSDPDDDLDVLTVIVTDESGTMVDQASTDVTGSTASSSNYFKIKHVDGRRFDVTLTVVDQQNNSMSASRTLTE